MVLSFLPLRNQASGGGYCSWGGNLSDHWRHCDNRHQHPGDGWGAPQCGTEGAGNNPMLISIFYFGDVLSEGCKLIPAARYNCVNSATNRYCVRCCVCRECCRSLLIHKSCQLNPLLKSLKVTDAIVVMDREQGAAEMLASRGIRVHPIISMFKLLDVLREAERIDSQMAQKVRKFILDNYTFRYSMPSSPKSGECVRALWNHVYIWSPQCQGGEW